MTSLLQPKSEEDIANLIARKLAPQYGDVSVHGTTFDFHQSTEPPDTIVAGTRELVIRDLNRQTVKDECTRRIFSIMKDMVTQLNITAFAVDLTSKQVNGYTPTEEETTAINMARALKDWVAAMQNASREIADAADPFYTIDSRWPPVPDGAQAFVDQF